jgi:hypothetical protein
LFDRVHLRVDHDDLILVRSVALGVTGVLSFTGDAASGVLDAAGALPTGRGLMASWLKRKQDAGEDIEKYRV